MKIASCLRDLVDAARLQMRRRSVQPSKVRAVAQRPGGDKLARVRYQARGELKMLSQHDSLAQDPALPQTWRCVL